MEEVVSAARKVRANDDGMREVMKKSGIVKKEKYLFQKITVRSCNIKAKEGIYPDK